MTSALPGVADVPDRLAHLGFLLVSPIPAGSADSELLVSLRDRPTLDHFDTERIHYWRTGMDRRGHPVLLDLRTTMPLRTTVTWGKVELVDRFGVENDFVTLGGTLAADRVAADEIVAVLRSSAPILRMGGHSQGADALGPDLAAFFGRIMVPVDFDPGTEAAISAADPLSRYAAFVAHQADRYHSHRILREEQLEAAQLVGEEAHRLRRARPDAWATGVALLERLRLRG